MATHYNTELSRAVQKKFKLKTGDMLTSEVTNAVGVYPILVPSTPVWNSSTTSGNFGITLPGDVNADRDKKFFVTAMVVGMSKNAACDAGSFMNITGVQDGNTIRIAAVASTTLTAEIANFTVNFANPFYLDPASPIAWSTTFTAGLLARSLVVYGYLE